MHWGIWQVSPFDDLIFRVFLTKFCTSRGTELHLFLLPLPSWTLIKPNCLVWIAIYRRSILFLDNCSIMTWYGWFEKKSASDTAFWLFAHWDIVLVILLYRSMSSSDISSSTLSTVSFIGTNRLSHASVLYLFLDFCIGQWCRSLTAIYYFGGSLRYTILSRHQKTDWAGNHSNSIIICKEISRMLYNGFTYSFIDFASHAQKSTNVALQQLAAIFAIIFAKNSPGTIPRLSIISSHPRQCLLWRLLNAVTIKILGCNLNDFTGIRGICLMKTLYCPHIQFNRPFEEFLAADVLTCLLRMALDRMINLNREISVASILLPTFVFISFATLMAWSESSQYAEISPSTLSSINSSCEGIIHQCVYWLM